MVGLFEKIKLGTAYPSISVLDTGGLFWRTRKGWWLKKYGLTHIEVENTEGNVYHMNGAYDKPGTTFKIPEWGKLREPHSIFDPVLAELVYQWFCPVGGKILDPFAGEACKGIVAGVLGYDYTGIEIRAKQVTANRQAATAYGLHATWIRGDSGKIPRVMPPAFRFDLVFTSPPYYDLERYTKSDVQDGSTFTTYEQFMAWYKKVFRDVVCYLKDDRFLVIKVGEFRGPDGAFRNFVGDNISMFTKLGLRYYNELILMHPVGSGCLRTNQFRITKKVVKLHQNVLVFFKTKSENVTQAVKRYLENENSTVA